MDGSDREGAEGTDEVRMIAGGLASGGFARLPATAKSMRTDDGRVLVSLNDASDIVNIARFLRDYRGPGLNEALGADAMRGLAALLDPNQEVPPEQAVAARDILGSIAAGTLSGAAPGLQPAAVSLLKHFA